MLLNAFLWQAFLLVIMSWPFVNSAYTLAFYSIAITHPVSLPAAHSVSSSLFPAGRGHSARQLHYSSTHLCGELFEPTSFSDFDNCSRKQGRQTFLSTVFRVVMSGLCGRKRLLRPAECTVTVQQHINTSLLGLHCEQTIVLLQGSGG